MGTSLYVLAGDYLAAAERLSDADLPAEVIADTLESLSGDLETKSIGVAKFIGNLEAQAMAIKVAEDQMAARRKAIERRADSIREYLKTNMERTGITKIECPYFKISLRDNPPSVVIDDEKAIPEGFMRLPEPPPLIPNKKLIAEALKAGEVVPGVHLERGKRVEIK